MIKFFRNSYLIQYLVTALLCVALWIPTFITGQVDVVWRSPVTPLYNLIADILDFWPPVMLVFGLVLTGFSAMFFNATLASNQLIGRVHTLGAVVYLLLMNLLPVQTTFHPFLLAALFLLMFVHTLFATYQTPRPELYLVNAGFFLAMASMCWFPSLLLVFWGIIALSIIHKGSLRLHLIPFIGLVTPYFFYFAAHFLMGDLLPVLQGYGDYFSDLHLTVAGFDWLRVAMLGFLLLVVTLPWFAPHNYSFEKSVAVRTKIMMTVILLLFGVLLLFVDEEPMRNGVLFIALGVLFSYEMASLDRLKWPNITFAVLMLAVLASHYLPLFLSR